MTLMGCSSTQERTYSYSNSDPISYQKEQEKKMAVNSTEEFASLLVTGGLFAQLISLI